MNAIYVLAIVCLVGAVVSLAWGVLAMAYGGDYDQRNSERLMFARVKWHALAVLALLLGYFVLI